MPPPKPSLGSIPQNSHRRRLHSLPPYCLIPSACTRTLRLPMWRSARAGSRNKWSSSVAPIFTDSEVTYASGVWGWKAAKFAPVSKEEQKEDGKSQKREDRRDDDSSGRHLHGNAELLGKDKIRRRDRHRRLQDCDREGNALHRQPVKPRDREERKGHQLHPREYRDLAKPLKDRRRVKERPDREQGHGPGGVGEEPEESLDRLR